MGFPPYFYLYFYYFSSNKPSMSSTRIISRDFSDCLFYALIGSGLYRPGFTLFIGDAISSTTKLLYSYPRVCTNYFTLFFAFMSFTSISGLVWHGLCRLGLQYIGFGDVPSISAIFNFNSYLLFDWGSYASTYVGKLYSGFSGSIYLFIVMPFTLLLTSYAVNILLGLVSLNLTVCLDRGSFCILRWSVKLYKIYLKKKI